MITPSVMIDIVQHALLFKENIMALTTQHDNGDVTMTWYGHEDVSTGLFAFYVVTFALLMLYIVMPTGVFANIIVAFLGGMIGVCGFLAHLILDGDTVYTYTYNAGN